MKYVTPWLMRTCSLSSLFRDFCIFLKLLQPFFFAEYTQTLSLFLSHPDSTEAEHLFIMIFIFFFIAYILFAQPKQKQWLQTYKINDGIVYMLNHKLTSQQI